MNKIAARVAATITIVSSLSSPNCGFVNPKKGTKMWYKKYDTRDTLNHVSRMKLLLWETKNENWTFSTNQVSPSDKRSRSKRALYVLSTSHAVGKRLEKSEALSICYVFFGSLIPCLFLSLFLSPSLPGLVRFLYKGSINDKEIFLQSRGVQLCYLEEIIYRS